MRGPANGSTFDQLYTTSRKKLLTSIHADSAKWPHAIRPNARSPCVSGRLQSARRCIGANAANGMRLRRRGGPGRVGDGPSPRSRRPSRATAPPTTRPRRRCTCGSSRNGWACAGRSVVPTHPPSEPARRPAGASALGHRRRSRGPPPVRIAGAQRSAGCGQLPRSSSWPPLDRIGVRSRAGPGGLLWVTGRDLRNTIVSKWPCMCKCRCVNICTCISDPPLFDGVRARSATPAETAWSWPNSTTGA